VLASKKSHHLELLAVHSKLRGSAITAATALPAGRRGIVLANQGLLGIAFFEATASIILLGCFFFSDAITRPAISVFGWPGGAALPSPRSANWRC